MSSKKLSVAVRVSVRNVRRAAFCATLTAVAAFPAEARAEEQAGSVAGREPSTLPRIRVESDVPDDYSASRTTTATRTDTPLRDVPQSVTVVTREVMADQAMQSMTDVVRYVPGMTMGQGEGNRDQLTIRGNGTTADFFLDGMRDDVQYFRDLYNVERVEALKGPNAMIFGRGGGGGVINRVSKQAQWDPSRELTVQAGSYDSQRIAVDMGQGLNEALALRVNAMYDDSGSYRDGVDLERYGFNPTVALALGERTLVRLGYEYFSDERTADRGIPSFLGRPLATDESTFFGDPELSRSDVEASQFSALVEHETAGGLVIRNRTRYADYDKFYQNVFPGALDEAGTQVSISAYNNATARENLFNQTDVTWSIESGGMLHTFLAGAELGRQRTDNFRNTGFFDNGATSFSTPLSNPTISVPVTFRQNQGDADNAVEADILAAYVQDQIEFSPHWQAIIGLRYDSFNLDFVDHRDGEKLSRDDDLVSPRAGLVYKPVEPLSLYASYSVSYLPGSGDQFASLTASTRTLEPEEFENYELGAKWDVREDLSLTAAVFQLDRTNTRAPDPNDPTLTVQTGSQRTKGLELGVSGAIAGGWRVMGGYAWQDAEITDRTAAAPAGATIPIAPEHMISLWNRYDLTPMWGFGLGVIYQDEMYAGIDNTVTLPSFTRVDGAVFLTLNDHLRAQVNVENVFDEQYYPTAHSNNNITPGSPPAVRLSLTGSF